MFTPETAMAGSILLFSKPIDSGAELMRREFWFGTIEQRSFFLQNGHGIPVARLNTNDAFHVSSSQVVRSNLFDVESLCST